MKILFGDDNKFIAIAFVAAQHVAQVKMRPEVANRDEIIDKGSTDRKKLLF